MENLQQLIDSKSNLVDFFYNDNVSQIHKQINKLLSKFNAPEYTNWRDEQRAWRESAILFDQSYHMPVLYVRGPDAHRMLNYLSPNTFENLSTDKGKQYIGCNARGEHIGDCVLYYYGEEKGFELISGMYLLNWIRFHGESGEYDVEMEFDPTSPFHPTGKRTKYRFQIEGPNARAILEDICDGGWPELKFFNIRNVKIAGCDVQVLRHGMAGHTGAELSGPYDELEKVRDAIVKAGKRHGLQLGGTRAYHSTPLENGWISYPTPAIYTGEDIRAFREWLPVDGWEASLQIGGSYYRQNIEDYYSTPWSLGYGHLVKFDHDFIGREALEKSKNEPKRTKRSLVWNTEDLIKIYRSQISDGPRYKAIEMPIAAFGFPQTDEVTSLDGKFVGISQRCGYNTNGRDVISLVSIDEDHAEIGTEVELTWGELNGGSRKPHVERHEQTTIRATVAPAPCSKEAQERLRASI